MEIDTNVFGFVQNILKLHSIYRTNSSRSFQNHSSVGFVAMQLFAVIGVEGCEKTMVSFNFVSIFVLFCCWLKHCSILHSKLMQLLFFC